MLIRSRTALSVVVLLSLAAPSSSESNLFTCPNGEQLSSDGGCEPCPRGTWRATGSGASCAPCPPGTTNPHPGAASPDQCSLPVCKPGSYLNVTLNTCIKCRKGTYQLETQQTLCIPCPINTSTRGPGAVSKSDCTNPCEMSGPDMHCDTNAYCLLIPETSEFKCQCKPGFNGTGKICTDVCLDFCDNGGECVKDQRGQPTCMQPGGHTQRNFQLL